VSAAALATLAVALIAANPARASSQFRSSFQMRYLSGTPRASTGLSTVMTWSDPGAPFGAPKALSRIELQFAKGTAFDTGALPACMASNLEVTLLQAAACPASSRLGGGTTIGVFATGQAFSTVVTLFNAPSQIIVLVTVGALTATVFRDDVHTDSITVNPALPPLVSLERLALQIDPHTTGATAYMRAPSSCPPSGRWAIGATFSYADGSSDTHESGSGCSSAAHRRHHRRPHRGRHWTPSEWITPRSSRA
jgi:hypothetical protein